MLITPIGLFRRFTRRCIGGVGTRRQVRGPQARIMNGAFTIGGQRGGGIMRVGFTLDGHVTSLDGYRYSCSMGGIP